MIPTDIFHQFVDAKVAFGISHGQISEPVFNVSRAKAGTLRLSAVGTREFMESDAHQILGLLNVLLCADNIRPGLEPEEVTFLDNGKCLSVAIHPEPAKSRQAGLGAVEIKSVILYGDDSLVQKGLAVYETKVGKASKLFLMNLNAAGDRMVEVARLSPHALPQKIHALMAGAGVSGDIDYRQVYEDLYGDTALAKADQAFERRREVWADALSEAKQKLGF